MSDTHPRPTHAQLRTIFQSLYEQMMDPIEGLSFGTVERHALPALSDGFKREYKKSWMESFQKHLARYDPQKLENVLQTVMKREGFNMNLVQNLWNILQKKRQVHL